MRDHRLFLVLIALLYACGGKVAREPGIGMTGYMLERSTKGERSPPIATRDVAVDHLDADPMLDAPHAPHAPGVGSPVPATRTWVNVSAGVLLESRTAGDDRIEPDEVASAALAAAGLRRASGTFRLCFDGRGAVVLVRTLIESGSPAYDEQILRELRTWKVRPHVVDGEPYGVCSEVFVSYPRRAP